MKSPQLESREEILRIIKMRESYEDAHRKTNLVYFEKFSFSKLIDEHPRLVISSIGPVLLIIISLFSN